MVDHVVSGVFTRSKVIACAIALVISSNVSNAADVAIPGTGDGMAVLQAVASMYNSENPGTKILIPPSVGSGGGTEAVGRGLNALGRVARPLNDKEKALGILYTPVMKIPAAIIANPTAGVSALTNAQLRGIFEGSISNWKEVGGADITIRVFRREDADSVFAVLAATMPGWKDIALSKNSKQMETTQELLDAVQFTSGAVGYAPYGRSLAGTVSVMAIDGKKPIDAGYPSAVVVALIHKEATVTPEAKKFMDFMLSAKGKTILSTLGAVSN